MSLDFDRTLFRQIGTQNLVEIHDEVIAMAFITNPFYEEVTGEREWEDLFTKQQGDLQGQIAIEIKFGKAAQPKGE
jgi:hypothetical protein